MRKINPISGQIKRSKPIQQWLLLTTLLVAATVVSFSLEPYVSLTSQAMLYVLIVAIASYSLSRKMAIFCAIAAVMALNFFFVPPRWTFQVESTDHAIAMVTMLVVALVINYLATNLRVETETAHENESRARQLQHLAIDLADAKTTSQAKARALQALDEAFPGKNYITLRDTANASEFDPDLIQAHQNGMQCCMKEAKVLGPGTGRWEHLDGWYLPLGSKEQMGGAAYVQLIETSHADIVTDSEPMLAALAHAHALTTILAQALWRLHLSASAQSAQIEAQRQQTQSIFLSAISHDLRTPLAVIIGAASSIETQGKKLNDTEQQRLLRSIINEANYLTTLTENTLQLVRLSNADRNINRDWESMEEIVGSVLARVRQHPQGCRIISKVANDLPLLKIDPVLIAQLISNLLDNALKYTELQVDLCVTLQRIDNKPVVQVAVKDRGAGIPEEDRLSIFEAYARIGQNDQVSQRGAGLGLAVCRAIALANGGCLALRQREGGGGGSSFILDLPIDLEQPSIG